MNKQLDDNRVIKNREEYVTLPQAALMVQMTEYAVGAMKGVIGFRHDPENPKVPLFHRDDLRIFMDQPNYRIYLGFEVFTNPGLVPREEDEMIDLWMVDKVTRLCRLYGKGDEEGLAKTSQEINARMREGR